MFLYHNCSTRKGFIIGNQLMSVQVSLFEEKHFSYHTFVIISTCPICNHPCKRNRTFNSLSNVVYIDISLGIWENVPSSMQLHFTCASIIAIAIHCRNRSKGKRVTVPLNNDSPHLLQMRCH